MLNRTNGHVTREKIIGGYNTFEACIGIGLRNNYHTVSCNIGQIGGNGNRDGPAQYWREYHCGGGSSTKTIGMTNCASGASGACVPSGTIDTIQVHIKHGTDSKITQHILNHINGHITCGNIVGRHHTFKANGRIGL
jgi:hypothetical protein